MEAEFIKVRARIYLLRTEEGGRESPILIRDPQCDLYRPLVDLDLGYINGVPVFCQGQLLLEEPAVLILGEEYTVTVQLVGPKTSVQRGTSFTIREEPRKVVGRGAVLEVLKVWS